MSLFEVYKQGQGTYSRAAVAALLGLLTAFGAFELYAAMDAWEAKIGGVVPWKLAVSGVVAAACAFGILVAVNGRKTVDFLIVTEAELRKVSWPTRRQLRQQTLVVIVVAVIFGVAIQIADWVYVNLNLMFYT